MEGCRYCDVFYQVSERTILENEFFFVNFDGHPVREGHMKLVLKRHALSLDELTDAEAVAYIDILQQAKALINERYHPDGFNVGTNEGEAAGQTIFHLHVHVIPRYKGDVANPVGGVRNIIPGKGDYTKA